MARFRRHGTFSLALITLFSQIISPNPWCLDCEFEQPWGYVGHVWDPFALLWAFAYPFIAGLFGLRYSWLSPFLVTATMITTQPLGGVALWSLKANEGPAIILFAFPIFCVLFGFGHFGWRIYTSEGHVFESAP